MAKISSYPTAQPDGSDILIGTDIQTGQTRNFSVDALTTYNANAYLKQISWEFIVNEPDSGVTDGKLFFNGYGGNGTNFIDITTIDINVKMPNATNAFPYLEYLLTDNPVDDKHKPAGNYIKFSDRHNLGSFGIYKFNSITPVAGDIYRLDLTPSNESVGKIYNKNLYAIEIDPIKTMGQTFVFIQTLSSATWNITHNLDTFPSVTVVDSFNTTVQGSVEYLDKNNITITFSAPFSGKAYLN